jgi:hypothetical protein
MSVSRALARYLELVDELLWRRAVLGSLSDDEEERFAGVLNDCRAGMTDDEEARIGELIANRRAIAAAESLALVDTEPADTDDIPLRKTG